VADPSREQRQSSGPDGRDNSHVRLLGASVTATRGATSPCVFRSLIIAHTCCPRSWRAGRTRPAWGVPLRYRFGLTSHRRSPSQVLLRIDNEAKRSIVVSDPDGMGLECFVSGTRPFYDDPAEAPDWAYVI
jgi:hypothetical protein